MKKRILIILSLILIGTMLVQNNGLGIFDKKVAYAVGDLTVVWQTTPLFNETNIAPGFNVTKNVNVANGATSPRPVAVKGILTSDSGNMKSVMDIEIKQGLTTLYTGTLAQFFADSASISGIPLSTLNNGVNTNYSFKVTFQSSAGNSFQNKTIVFDLQIGVGSTVPQACENMTFNGKTIFGTSGKDNISGTSKNDLIITFENDDKVNAGGGDDCIVTGSGNDTVDGQTGKDVIDLGEGNDKNNPSAGQDLVLGGDGNDNIDAGSDNDKVFGGNGNDKLIGGSGNDEIFGENDNDKLEGGSGSDKLTGGPGTDSATGGSGTDTCDAETESTCEL